MTQDKEKTKKEIICKEKKVDMKRIDGIRFQKPEEFSDYLLVGFSSIFYIIALPLIIPLYILGKIVTEISKDSYEYQYTLSCPICKKGTLDFTEKYSIFDYECDECGKKYMNNELKIKKKGNEEKN